MIFNKILIIYCGIVFLAVLILALVSPNTGNTQNQICPIFTKNLSKGSVDQEVIFLRKHLESVFGAFDINLGNSSLYDEDVRFYVSLYQVVFYQYINGISEADGVWNSGTRQSVNQYLNCTNPGVPRRVLDSAKNYLDDVKQTIAGYFKKAYAQTTNTGGRDNYYDARDDMKAGICVTFNNGGAALRAITPIGDRVITLKGEPDTSFLYSPKEQATARFRDILEENLLKSILDY